MGPKRAASIFLKSAEGKDADHFRVTLYGSLAATGRGHLTDQAIIDTLSQKGEVEIVWKPDVFLKFHPNGMKFEALGTDGSTVDSWTVFSIGGGTLANEHFNEQTERKVYEMRTSATSSNGVTRQDTPFGNTWSNAKAKK